MSVCLGMCMRGFCVCVCLFVSNQIVACVRWHSRCAGPPGASRFLAGLPPGSWGRGSRAQGPAPSIFSCRPLPVASVAVLIWSSWSHWVGHGPACAACAAKTALMCGGGDVRQRQRRGEVGLVFLSCPPQRFQILLMRSAFSFLLLTSLPFHPTGIILNLSG